MAPREQVQLWLVRADEIHDAGLLRAYRQLLPPEERAHLAARGTESSRREFLIGRALVRTVLSRHHPATRPEDWRFLKNSWGRPEIAKPESAAGLRFNLSHTPGLVACALVARENTEPRDAAEMAVDVGVDVEKARPRRFAEVAEDFFAEPEVEALRRLPEAERAARFFRIWTLKESYIKARGMGLAIDLGLFHFRVDGAAPTIALDPTLGDEPSGWKFTSERPTDEHFLALAVRTPRALDVERWRTVPLRDAERLSTERLADETHA